MDDASLIYPLPRSGFQEKGSSEEGYPGDYDFDEKLKNSTENLFTF